MKRVSAIRLCVALAAELLLFAALNFFDDWTLESMPAKFVGVALLSGVVYLIAVSSFKIDPLRPRRAANCFQVAGSSSSFCPLS